MFTGIIEKLGIVTAIEKEHSNYHFFIQSPLSHELKIDQSVAHNGVCLTVVEVKNNVHKVTAIDETLQKTNLGNWKIGDLLNIERCLPANGRFDGHIVQGHVDQTAICKKIENQNGSWKYYFEYDSSSGNLTVKKGSICINGVSLTVVDSENNGFSVAIIPYTYEHTNFKTFEIGTVVNLEFDILGKYIQKLMLQRL